MRVTIALIFAFLALAFVEAYPAVEVSVYANTARKLWAIVNIFRSSR